jgi:hypothetical protein
MISPQDDHRAGALSIVDCERRVGLRRVRYDTASDTFKPATTSGTPPQGNDAKCGYACHTRAKARDYVFTEYGKR